MAIKEFQTTRYMLVLGVVLGLALSACAKTPPPCAPISYGGNDYTVCTANVKDDFRLFLKRERGTPLRSFEAVEARLERTGERLAFAMNAGMYHDDRSPVGLYVENGVHHAPLNTSARDGNFGLVPNGVFFVNADGAGVAETNVFAQMSTEVDYATQSGPMLVIGGALHPKFNKGAPSRKKRNGVGITSDNQTVYFVISEGVVNFHDFASFFRNHLDTPNALFLDGTVSRLYDRASGRSDAGLPMGPMVGLVVPN